MSMSQTKINDNVFVLTDGVNVRFVVLLPLSNYPKSHKISLVILTLGNDIAKSWKRVSLALSWEQDTNSWERHSKLVGTT